MCAAARGLTVCYTTGLVLHYSPHHTCLLNLCKLTTVAHQGGIDPSPQRAGIIPKDARSERPKNESEAESGVGFWEAQEGATSSGEFCKLPSVVRDGNRRPDRKRILYHSERKKCARRHREIRAIHPSRVNLDARTCVHFSM